MRHLIKIFKALSDGNRLRILKMLEVRPLCVCEITEVLQLAPSTVSKHLALLRDAGLILDEKIGKWVNFSTNDAPNQSYVSQLLPLLQQWLPDDPQIQRDREKVLAVDRDQLCKS